MASLIEQKIIPISARVSLNVVLTETLSITASTATPESSFCSSSGIPSLLKVLSSSGSTSSRLFGPACCLAAKNNILVRNFGYFKMGPLRHFHGKPMPVGFKPEFEHEFRFLL
jgi:hypothetical protein